MPKPFSEKLESWLVGDEPKTMAGLNSVFAERSVGIIIFVLMFLPALPLPTGGVSHVFEIATMLLALQLMLGRRTIWIPKRWEHREITGLKKGKTAATMVKIIRWLERFSRPRKSAVVGSRAGLAVIGLLTLVYALAAFLAPPFSGLDTLPSIGVVIMALGLILGDISFVLIGIVAGAVGVGIIIGAGTVVIQLTRHFF